MRIQCDLKQWRFSASWFATLLLLLVAPVMIRLGVWQYDRAQEKTALQLRFNEVTNAERVPLSQSMLNDLEGHRYKPVLASGKYLGQYQFILDNQPQGLISGYGVITPMLTEYGVILVNRGWIERPVDRTQLPKVDVGEQARQIQGRINLPGKAFGLGPMTLESGWPRRIQYIDYLGMDELLKGVGIQEPLMPFVMMLAENDQNGYLRRWEPVAKGPEKHYAYMVQWFAMALTVCVIYLVLNTKRIRSNDE